MFFFYWSASGYAASFAQHKQRKPSTLLKTRRIPSQTFFSQNTAKICLPGNFMLNISENNFSKHSERLVLEEIISSDSECLRNNNSVQQKITRNCHSDILQSKISKASQTKVAIPKELVDGTLERDFTKATNAFVRS